MKRDLCVEMRGWERMRPETAKKKGHLKCDICEANYKFAVENKKDVVVDRLSGDIIAVCMEG